MAIKKRQMNEFIESVNKPAQKKEVLPKNPERSGRKKFKAITIQFSEDEYNELVEAAEKYRQTLVGVIRFAVSQLNKEND